MPRPLSLLPALVAVAATAAALAAVPAPVAAAGSGRLPAAPAIEDESPLQVSIDVLTPSEIPDRGRIRMRGRVTNVSDETWRAINVHAFVGDVPMTTSEEIAEATLVPAAADVGDRITIPGTFDGIGSLFPGESSRFVVRLSRAQVAPTLPGVYWFGAHALGNTDEARDGVADGRARTFLPLVDSRRRAVVDTSLVVPLRRTVRYTRNGRLTGVPGWARDLGPGGSLRELVDLGGAAGTRPVSWLVDPAVLRVVQQLVGGNPARSLASTVSPAERPEQPDPPEESASPSTPPSSESTDSGEQPARSAAATAGEAWLTRLESALSGARVLMLPFGDTDVSAAVDHAPDLLRSARQRSGENLAPFGTPALPAVAPPSGFLPLESLPQLPPDTITLLSDRMLPETSNGTVFDVDGQRVLFADAAAAEGGPGPDDPLATVSLRQRILAEAAVRLLDERRTPLLVMLPPTRVPDDPAAFFGGLDVRWLDLTEVSSLDEPRPLAPERLDYPAEQRAAEPPAATFLAAEQLVEAGATMANLLADNDEIDEQVSDQALASLSYGQRTAPTRAREDLDRSTRWLGQRLSSVAVSTPRGVTLAGVTGRFGMTVTNGLDHPVTISLKAITDAGLAVDTPATLELAAGSSQTLELDAQASRPGVHYVRLVVTDDTGAPLGSSAMLPVRSAQVSQVIWLILGVGVGLLFLAIAVRLVRRVRSDRP